MFIILSCPDKPLLQNTDQVIQPPDAKIRMRMFLQMHIPLIQKQHRGSASHMSSRHIVNAITNHDQILTISKTPFTRDMQDARGIRLGQEIGRVPRDDWQEDMAVEMVVDQVLDWCSKRCECRG
jgi:hypothetical protein